MRIARRLSLARTLVAGVLLAALSPVPRVAAQAPAAQTSATPALRIVVIAGEDAVNVVQQRSAVAPVVEVRDRNNQPVAGAIVRFAVRSGRVTFGDHAA